MRYYKQIIDNYLTAIGTGPGNIEITEAEYNEITRTIRKKRAETVQQLIKELAQAIGSDETKSMVRATLREL